MTITFIHISEDEFELLFSFITGYKGMGNPEDADKALANKLFQQLLPIAKMVYGFEFEKIMKGFKDLQETVAGMNIVLEKNYPPSPNKGQN